MSDRPAETVRRRDISLMTARIPELFSVGIVDAAGYTPENAAVAFDRET